MWKRTVGTARWRVSLMWGSEGDRSRPRNVKELCEGLCATRDRTRRPMEKRVRLVCTITLKIHRWIRWMEKSVRSCAHVKVRKVKVFPFETAEWVEIFTPNAQLIFMDLAKFTFWKNGDSFLIFLKFLLRCVTVWVIVMVYTIIDHNSLPMTRERSLSYCKIMTS